MAETAEKRKKVYKLATELNISHETLIEFLRKKGHEVKSHMSSVDEDMMKDILVHFKKEKDVAEKHQRKIAEIRETKKRAERRAEEVAELAPSAAQHQEAIVEESGAPPLAAAAELPVLPTGPALEMPPGKTPADVTAESEAAEAQHEAPMAEAAETREAVVAVPRPVERPPAPKVELRKPRSDEALSPLEKQTRAKMGLTIKGKMDLGRQARPAPGKAGKGAPGAAAPVLTEEDHKRKKKKKKVGGKGVVETKAAEVDDLERKKKKKKKIRHKDIDQAEVTDAIRRTFAAMDDTPVTGRAVLKKRKRKEREEEVARLAEEARMEEGKLRVTEFVSVNDLANLMRVNVADVIKKCMELGIMVSINQRLDRDTITLVADEFGFEISFYAEEEEKEALNMPKKNLKISGAAPP